MKMKKSKTRTQKRKYTALIVLGLLLVMTAASFAIAYLWQNNQEDGLPFFSFLGTSEPAAATEPAVTTLPPEKPTTTQPSTTVPTTATTTAPSTAPTTATAVTPMMPPTATAPTTPPPATIPLPSVPVSEPSASAGTTTAASTESDFFRQRREEYAYALPETTKVPTSYFDDAIFFGDSISTGIPLYNVMPNARVMAFTGIGTFNVATKECIMTDDGRKTLLDAALQYGEKAKVYIMLGGNGLGSDKESFVADYRNFLRMVKAQYPKSLIYVQTMTPVTDDAYKTYPSVSNAIIEEYNLALQDMAQEERVLFLDVASALMDENGKLPKQASPVDGMHFSAEYYTKWFDYLRTHTAAPK